MWKSCFVHVHGKHKSLINNQHIFYICFYASAHKYNKEIGMQDLSVEQAEQWKTKCFICFKWVLLHHFFVEDGPSYCMHQPY